MVDWKIYIDSPQKRALELCSGSMDEGNGCGDGAGDGHGCGDIYGWVDGDGWGNGYSYDPPCNGWGNGYCDPCRGDGESATEW